MLIATKKSARSALNTRFIRWGCCALVISLIPPAATAQDFLTFVRSLPSKYERRQFWFYWFLYRQKQNSESRKGVSCDYDDPETLNLLCPPTLAPMIREEHDTVVPWPIDCIDEPELPGCEKATTTSSPSLGIEINEQPTGASGTANLINSNGEDDFDAYFECLGNREIDNRFCQRPDTPAPGYYHHVTTAPLTHPNGGEEVNQHNVFGSISRPTDENQQHNAFGSISRPSEEADPDEHLFYIDSINFDVTVTRPPFTYQGANEGTAEHDGCQGTLSLEPIGGVSATSQTFPELPPIQLVRAAKDQSQVGAVHFSVSQTLMEDRLVDGMALVYPGIRRTPGIFMLCDRKNQVPWGATRYYAAACGFDGFADIELYFYSSELPAGGDTVELPKYCDEWETTTEPSSTKTVGYQARLPCTCDPILFDPKEMFGSTDLREDHDTGLEIDFIPCEDVNLTRIEPTGDDTEHLVPGLPPVDLLYSDGATVKFSVSQTIKEGIVNGMAVVFPALEGGITCDRFDDVVWGSTKYYDALCRNGAAHVLLSFYDVTLDSPINEQASTFCNPWKDSSGYLISYMAYLPCDFCDNSTYAPTFVPFSATPFVVPPFNESTAVPTGENETLTPSQTPETGPTAGCMVSLQRQHGNVTPELPPIEILSYDEDYVSFSVSQTFKESGGISWMGVAYKSAEEGGTAKLVCDESVNLPWGKTLFFRAACKQATSDVLLYLLYGTLGNVSNTFPGACNGWHNNKGYTESFKAILPCHCQTNSITEPDISPSALSLLGNPTLSPSIEGDLKEPSLMPFNTQLQDLPMPASAIHTTKCLAIVIPQDSTYIPQLPPIMIQAYNNESVSFSVSQTFKESGEINWLGVLYPSLEDGGNPKQVCNAMEKIPWGTTKYYEAACTQHNAEVLLYVDDDKFTAESTSFPQACIDWSNKHTYTISYKAILPCQCQTIDDPLEGSPPSALTLMDEPTLYPKPIQEDTSMPSKAYPTMNPSTINNISRSPTEESARPTVGSESPAVPTSPLIASPSSPSMGAPTTGSAGAPNSISSSSPTIGSGNAPSATSESPTATTSPTIALPSSPNIGAPTTGSSSLPSSGSSGSPTTGVGSAPPMVPGKPGGPTGPNIVSISFPSTSAQTSGSSGSPNSSGSSSPTTGSGNAPTGGSDSSPGSTNPTIATSSSPSISAPTTGSSATPNSIPSQTTGAANTPTVGSDSQGTTGTTSPIIALPSSPQITTPTTGSSGIPNSSSSSPPTTGAGIIPTVGSDSSTATTSPTIALPSSTNISAPTTGSSSAPNSSSNDTQTTGVETTTRPSMGSGSPAGPTVASPSSPSVGGPTTGSSGAPNSGSNDTPTTGAGSTPTIGSGSPAGPTVASPSSPSVGGPTTGSSGAPNSGSNDTPPLEQDPPRPSALAAQRSHRCLPSSQAPQAWVVQPWIFWGTQFGSNDTPPLEQDPPRPSSGSPAGHAGPTVASQSPSVGGPTTGSSGAPNSAQHTPTTGQDPPHHRLWQPSCPTVARPAPQAWVVQHWIFWGTNSGSKTLQPLEQIHPTIGSGAQRHCCPTVASPSSPSVGGPTTGSSGAPNSGSNDTPTTEQDPPRPSALAAQLVPPLPRPVPQAWVVNHWIFWAPNSGSNTLPTGAGSTPTIGSGGPAGPTVASPSSPSVGGPTTGSSGAPNSGSNDTPTMRPGSDPTVASYSPATTASPTIALPNSPSMSAPTTTSSVAPSLGIGGTPTTGAGTTPTVGTDSPTPMSTANPSGAASGAPSFGFMCDFAPPSCLYEPDDGVDRIFFCIDFQGLKGDVCVTWKELAFLESIEAGGCGLCTGSASPMTYPHSMPAVLFSEQPSSTLFSRPSQNPSTLLNSALSGSPSEVAFDPTLTPSSSPSISASGNPSLIPSIGPSDSLTRKPTIGPTVSTSDSFSLAPSPSPSMKSSLIQSMYQSFEPTTSETSTFTFLPTENLDMEPIQSQQPTTTHNACAFTPPSCVLEAHDKSERVVFCFDFVGLMGSICVTWEQVALLKSLEAGNCGPCNNGAVQPTNAPNTVNEPATKNPAFQGTRPTATQSSNNPASTSSPTIDASRTPSMSVPTTGIFGAPNSSSSSTPTTGPSSYYHKSNHNFHQFPNKYPSTQWPAQRSPYNQLGAQ
ncbi:AHNAK nucleoprotein [Seminavis robusta]|uniref:AHNAK nucleoprotein n=1 Tax=Seminavis robusta TaxID=568900 RepID=A0A9N8E015_9STRA|nr:AHNAK nucleoprotein [Seminavis robusta]|eukprot:Sro485_g152390.1 AHNAK nucleoprotein (2133) ;mRNA; f:18768-25598